MISTTILTQTAAATSAPWWVAPAVIAAVIAGIVGVITLIVNGRRARVDRQRVRFAQVLGDLAAYREFVYIVRRRRHDEPEAERVRISTELSKVQKKLNHHAAVLRVEAPRVATTFVELLRVTRQVAGGAIRQGWETAPITEDSGIHVDVDLTGIEPYEDAYLIEVADHLSPLPGAARRRARAAMSRIHAFRARDEAIAAPATASERVA